MSQSWRTRTSSRGIRGLVGACTVLALLGVAGCGGSPGAGASSSNSSTPSATGGIKEYSPPGDIPDDQAFVPYSPPGAQLSMKVPEGWARSNRHGSVRFTDKLNSVRIESHPAASAPMVQSATAQEVPAIAETATNFSAGDVTTVERSAGPAVLITYQADTAPDPVTGKVVRDAVERYEFWQHGTEAVLTLSGPVGADNVDPWRIVSDSFSWR